MQYFINEDGNERYLDCIVNFRSNDAVFGFNNDALWAKYIQQRLAKDLQVNVGKLYWNAGSLHVYERHFKYLED
jgi:thymidylate synthase